MGRDGATSAHPASAQFRFIGPNGAPIRNALVAHVAARRPFADTHETLRLRRVSVVLRLERSEPAESTFISGGRLTMELTDFH